ncbi:MAG TPA: hypothetical protein VFS55_01050, partial [Dokdonella sp.]|nr:hypothetical protein [Dokdonella sp.]
PYSAAIPRDWQPFFGATVLLHPGPTRGSNVRRLVSRCGVVSGHAVGAPLALRGEKPPEPRWRTGSATSRHPRRAHRCEATEADTGAYGLDVGDCDYGCVVNVWNGDK